MAKQGQTKYQKWIKKDGLLKIEGWARNGLSNAQIAKNIGVKPETFCKWKDQFPDLREAVERGQKPLEVELENALIKKALGYVEETPEEVEEITDKGGVVVRHKKKIKRVYPPDTSALIFLLKNRMSNIYQDRPKTELEKENQRLINEHQRLQNELIRKTLQDSNAGLEMVKRLIDDIDGEVVEEVIEEAEEVLEGGE